MIPHRNYLANAEWAAGTATMSSFTVEPVNQPSFQTARPTGPTKHSYIMNILFPIASYLIGAIPFGLLIGRLAGIDVRLSGSGNIGATNVARLLGKKLGAVTLVLDCLKGFLPIYLASRLLPEGPQRETVLLLCGIMAVVGHMFPLYLGFKGGKGVATGLGVFLFLSPAAIGISLLVFVAAVGLSGFVSVGSLLASGLFPLWLWLQGQPGASVATGAIIALLIWIKHQENIGRLIRGQEKSWRKK
jgi:glycerol-3-phosphate acyltransferase PlsY